MTDNPHYSTGYWAGYKTDGPTPKYPFSSRTHSLVDGRPLCGYKPSPKASYYFCAEHSRTYGVDCKRCLNKLQDQKNERKAPRVRSAA